MTNCQECGVEIKIREKAYWHCKVLSQKCYERLKWNPSGTPRWLNRLRNKR